MAKRFELTSNDTVASHYISQRDLLLKGLKQLPPTEMHYYFALLVASIENEPNPGQHTHLIIKAHDVIKKLNKFYADINNNQNPDVTEINDALNALIISSKMQSTPHQVKMAALSICSMVSGFISGCIGATTGFIGGLLSDYTVVGNLRASGFGFAIGLVLGAHAGLRCPKMIFQSAFERKLEFCIESIHKVGNELPTKKSHAEYEAETKKYILGVFFNDTPDAEKEAAFNQFLESKEQQIQVGTITAGFVHQSLKGHLGHHYFIAYSINGKQRIPMEYGDRIKTPKGFDQQESPRIITGRKLFDMLVLDRILQETYHYSLNGVRKDYDIGSNDCRTYADKLLIGTGQAPTQIKRFNPKVDKPSATHLIGPLVRFFSKTKETELVPLVPHYRADPNDQDPEVIVNKWRG